MRVMWDSPNNRFLVGIGDDPDVPIVSTRSPGMLPIRCASDGQMPVAAIIGNLNDHLAHAGSVLGHRGQPIQDSN